MTPQIIYLSLVFTGLIIAANQHGKERSPHNFWVTLVATFISISILYWGGFFSVIFG